MLNLPPLKHIIQPENTKICFCLHSGHSPPYLQCITTKGHSFFIFSNRISDSHMHPLSWQCVCLTAKHSSMILFLFSWLRHCEKKKKEKKLIRVGKTEVFINCIHILAFFMIFGMFLISSSMALSMFSVLWKSSATRLMRTQMQADSSGINNLISLHLFLLSSACFVFSRL